MGQKLDIMQLHNYTVCTLTEGSKYHAQINIHKRKRFLVDSALHSESLREMSEDDFTPDERDWCLWWPKCKRLARENEQT